MATQVKNKQLKDSKQRIDLATANGQIVNDPTIGLKGRKLDRLLFPNEPFNRFKAIPSVFAQSSTQFLENKSALVGDSRFRLEQLASAELSKPWRVLLYVLASGKTRVSQVLSAKSANVTPYGELVLSGSKGSNHVIIQDSRIREYLLCCRRTSCDLFYGINRFMVYRYLKSRGYEYSRVGMVNSAVTHAPRYSAVEGIDATIVGREASTVHLGHKSSKSTSHYGRRTK